MGHEATKITPSTEPLNHVNRLIDRLKSTNFDLIRFVSLHFITHIFRKPVPLDHFSERLAIEFFKIFPMKVISLFKYQ